MEAVRHSQYQQLSPKQLQLRSEEIGSKAVKEVIILADNPEHLQRMVDIAAFPLKEFDNGLFTDDTQLEQVGEMIASQAREQLAFSKR